MSIRSITMLCVGGALALSAHAADDLTPYLDESRAATKALVTQLAGELKKALEAGGPANAVAVCRDLAPKIASDISVERGWQVRRVSLKTRNPMIGTPDAGEQQILQEFDRRVAAGEKAETLEHAEIVTEPAGRYFRYVKALPVGTLCLNCHGDEKSVGSETAQALAARYPHDRARGYHEGEVRGAVSIKRRID